MVIKTFEFDPGKVTPVSWLWFIGETLCFAASLGFGLAALLTSPMDVMVTGYCALSAFGFIMALTYHSSAEINQQRAEHYKKWANHFQQHRDRLMPEEGAPLHAHKKGSET